MKFLLLITILTTPAFGREVKYTKKVDLDVLEREFRSSGFKIQYSRCDAAGCTTYLDPKETKDPMPIINAHVYVDPAQKRQALRDELARIEAKLDDESASVADLRKALKIILRLTGLTQSP